MSFAGTSMQRMTGAGLSCLAAMARVAAILILCFSVICVAFDPYSPVAAVVSLDETADVADTMTPPTPDADDMQVRVLVWRAPDSQFDKLSAERLKLARSRSLACVFEARGPPA